MKNKTKVNIICFLVAVLLLVGVIPSTVHAAEPQFGSSTVKYTVDDYFYVRIPETINVGNESTIYA